MADGAWQQRYAIPVALLTRKACRVSLIPWDHARVLDATGRRRTDLARLAAGPVHPAVLRGDHSPAPTAGQTRGSDYGHAGPVFAGRLFGRHHMRRANRGG